MGLVIKAALGALVVLLIGVLAKTKNYYIAGLIPLFPTFALIAHYIVASELTGMMRLPAAFVGSVSCWGISAWVLIICWIKLH
ncbi:GlpM family protein [Shigella sonnei]|nr:GlpM family protein [Shigella sonnei]